MPTVIDVMVSRDESYRKVATPDRGRDDVRGLAATGAARWAAPASVNEFAT